MEINDNLFENILAVGRANEETTIFDDIAVQEEKLAENQDLYDAYEKINKVLESPSRYNEIQTVAPTINVNDGTLKIAGVCKHDVKADAQDLNQVDDADDNNAYTTNIIDTFAGDLANVIPDNLNLEYELADDTMPKMMKKHFSITISRKG